MAFSADGNALIAGTWRGEIKFWHLDGSTKATTFPGHFAGQALAWLPACVAEAGHPATGKTTPARRRPDGQAFVSAGTDIRFWDVRTCQQTGKLTARVSSFTSVALSPDGRRLAAGTGDGRITIWDVASHQEVAMLEGHQEEVSHLAFTPEGDHLVSVSKDQLRVWCAASPAETDAPR